MKRCKWCNNVVEDKDLTEHEENCDSNDGGTYERNCEDVANKYF